MKQLITSFLLLYLSTGLNAQVCVPEIPPTEEPVPIPGETTARVQSDYTNDFSFSGPKQGILRLGYGINTIISLNQNQFSSSRNGLSWFNDHPAHVFDLSGELGKRRKWVAGFSFSFQKLGNLLREKTYQPSDYGFVDDPELNPFTVKFGLKARIYVPQVYTEYSFVNFGKQFSGIIRLEAGLSIYRAHMDVKYKDTCGCEKILASDWDMPVAFNAGVGLGFKWQYRFIGLKALLVYQSQTKVNFRGQEDYSNYSFDFNASNYDFRSIPATSAFTILKSGEETWKRYNPLYLQFMLYFRIGQN